MEFLPSAFKHGIIEADIRCAIDAAVAHAEISDDPTRKELIIGFDQAGRPLEIVRQISPDDKKTWFVIHAMPLRKSYEKYVSQARNRRKTHE